MRCAKVSFKVCVGAQALVVMAALLAGCGPYLEDGGRSAAKTAQASKPKRIDPALLKAAAAPDCEASGGREAAGKASASSSEPSRPALAGKASVALAPAAETSAAATWDMTQRIKLEYERECYRQAEARVRAQLGRLQASMGEDRKPARRLEDQYR
jgi:hypothetical protein